MPNGRRLSRLGESRSIAQRIHFDSHACGDDSRYRHVLVSTSLDLADGAALLLAFELASLHESTLTVLHVLPRLKQQRSAHGLDAIGLLHDAADELALLATGIASEPARTRFRKFMEDIVPRGLLSAVRWRGICRPGDVAKTVVSYVNESAADLVILSAGPSRWRLPLVPLAEWTIQRRARANVIVVRGQAPSLLS